MGFDFGNAPKQQAKRIIPPHSKVKLCLAIVYPTNTLMQGASDPACKLSKSSSMEYLDTTLTVVDGSFAGLAIRQNFNIAGATSDKGEQAIDISRALLRAMLEQFHGVSPDDNSTAASTSRVVETLSELDGIVFFGKIGCRIDEYNNTKFVKNYLEAVSTVDDHDWADLLAQGEIITDNAIPDPNSSAKTKDKSTRPPRTQTQWGAPQAQTASAQTQWTKPAPAPAPAASNPIPKWAQGPQQTSPAWTQQTPPPPPSTPAPSQQSNIDSVPF